MEDLLSTVLGLFCGGGLLCLMFLPIPWIGSFLVLPFLYRSTFASWTAGPTSRDAFDAVAVGATRGVFQIRPASYLWEQDFDVDQPAAQVREQVEASLRKVLRFGSFPICDADGVVVDQQIPSGLGPGWVGVALVEPRGEGAVVRCRWRNAQCIPAPVLTFFLSLTLRLHLRRMVLG